MQRKANMRNYKAEQILDAATFPSLWVSNLQEKHIDLLIERILFYMVDHEQLTEKQWENFNCFLTTIDKMKSIAFVCAIMYPNTHLFMPHIKSAYFKQALFNNESCIAFAISKLNSAAQNKQLAKEQNRLGSKVAKYAESKIKK